MTSISEVVEHLGGQVYGGDRGGWQRATCPLHDDTAPSASVNETTGKFRCHPCDFSGDAIALVMEAKSVGFLAARSYLAAELGDSDAGVPGHGDRGGGLLVGPRNHRSGSKGNAPWLRL